MLNNRLNLTKESTSSLFIFIAIKKRKLGFLIYISTGGGGGIRTPEPEGTDLQSAAFGQLRYPSRGNIIKLVAGEGFEPPTFGL